ncbi:MAG: hypothetical protein BAJALOKI2v1_30093 [Promethearchaeota archaeon]|nr:MAG: hypothetical protein BAJALOKI2v1_30093 [Candidatus Lokiarchaeota archaeon]
MKIDYGKTGMEFSLDPNWKIDIFNPKEQRQIKKPIEKIRKAIRNPIGSLPLENIIKQKKLERINKVCIVVSDATRPVPSKFILKGLVSELNSYGISDKKIKVLIATGLHRASSEDELKRIVGEKLQKTIEIVDHVANDKGSLKYLGKTEEKVPIYINKHFIESDLRILTGYVEPHFFFGFSGGRKSIVPGIAGEETIRGNHSAKNISSPHAKFGTFEKNPMHQQALNIAKIVGVDFIVNVCINETHKITKICAGGLHKAHEQLVKYQIKKVFKSIENPYDIVVCGNGGYPLDLNLYQAVKSMAIGEMGVKEGGTIISVNELSDGIGQDNFKSLIFSGKPPKELYRKIINNEISVPDQWEIQILARILMKADIYVVSSLKKHELGNIGLKFAPSVEDAIYHALKKHGSDSNILILPHGPQILPKMS